MRTLLVFSAYAVAMVALFVWLMPAHGRTKWPTVAELQRCEPWPKDAKLRAWCTYWSRRLP